MKNLRLFTEGFQFGVILFQPTANKQFRFAVGEPE